MFLLLESGAAESCYTSSLLSSLVALCRFVYLSDLAAVINFLCIYLALLEIFLYTMVIYDKVGFPVPEDLAFEDGLMDANDLVRSTTITPDSCFGKM